MNSAFYLLSTTPRSFQGCPWSSFRTFTSSPLSVKSIHLEYSKHSSSSTPASPTNLNLSKNHSLIPNLNACSCDCQTGSGFKMSWLSPRTSTWRSSWSSQSSILLYKRCTFPYNRLRIGLLQCKLRRSNLKRRRTQGCTRIPWKDTLRLYCKSTFAR